MHIIQILMGVLGVLLSLSPYLSAQEPGRAVPVTTDLKNAAGQIVGHVTLTQLEAGVRVAVQVHGLPPGMYPMHFHSVGKCDPPDFRSSGGVFGSPMGHEVDEHGQPHPPEGSLPSLTVRRGGHTKAIMLNPHVSLWPAKVDSLLHPGGTALVIHGARSKKIMACGVITAEQAQEPERR